MEYLYALIKDSVVINKLVFEDPSEELLNHFKNEYGADTIMDVTERTDCNVNCTWNGIKFIPPQPFPSWQYDEDFDEWIPPVPRPLPSTDGIDRHYHWNEEILDWEEVPFH
jgi:hypothetical protein